MKKYAITIELSDSSDKLADLDKDDAIIIEISDKHNRWTGLYTNKYPFDSDKRQNRIPLPKLTTEPTDSGEDPDTDGCLLDKVKQEIDLLLPNVFKKLYCPRCGYEGIPTIRAFTYGLIGSPFVTFCGIGTIVFICIVLLLTCLAWFVFLFTLPVIGILGLIVLDIFGTCCPKCRYSWDTPLKEHRRRLKSPNYEPPHNDNLKNVYKNGKTLPWWRKWTIGC